MSITTSWQGLDGKTHKGVYPIPMFRDLKEGDRFKYRRSSGRFSGVRIKRGLGAYPLTGSFRDYDVWSWTTVWRQVPSTKSGTKSGTKSDTKSDTKSGTKFKTKVS